MSLPQLDLGFDPMVVALLTGPVWTVIQAALDKPWWTPTRRRILVAVAALILSVAIWFAGAYPLTWQMILTQTGMILGYATASYWILKRITINGISLLDWIGLITPGGEPRVVESTATVTSETPIPTQPTPTRGVTAVPRHAVTQEDEGPTA